MRCTFSFLLALLLVVIANVGVAQNPTQQFTRDGVQCWNCRWKEGSPIILNVLGKDGQSNLVCIGHVICDARQLSTGDIGTNGWIATCEVNPNGTCPTAYEALTSTLHFSPVIGNVLNSKEIRVQPRADAVAEIASRSQPPFLGIEMADPSTPVVTKVHDASTAYMLDIHVGDQIVAIGTHSIADFASLRTAVAKLTIGDPVTATVKREGKIISCGPIPLWPKPSSKK